MSYHVYGMFIVCEPTDTQLLPESMGGARVGQVAAAPVPLALPPSCPQVKCWLCYTAIVPYDTIRYDRRD